MINMLNADRDASIFELVLRSIADIRKESPEFFNGYDGLIALDTLIDKAMQDREKDYDYGMCIFVLMLSAMCHKFLFELMSDSDIQQALIESGEYKESPNAS